MKKLFKLSSFLMLIIFLVFSCSKQETDREEASQSNLSARVSATTINQLVRINESTDLFSKLFFNLGAKSITVERLNNKTAYKFTTSKPFGFVNNQVDLANFVFILEENMLYIENRPEYYINIIDGEIILNTPTEQTNIETYAELGRNEPGSILTMFFNELKMGDEIKTPFTQHYQNHESSGSGSGGIGCTFFNTYYVVGAGLTTSAANASLIGYTGQINSFSCTKLNTSPDVTNWGGFYTSVDTYCCPSCFPNCGSGGSW